MKKGLVLEGGAMRGLFSAGVIDVLMENNIEFDGLVGVSAGAAFGCNYKSRQIGRAARYNIKYCNDPRYCSFWSLVKTGDLFGKDFCYRKLPEELDIFDKKAFEANPMEFYAVCTDVMTGEPIYKRLDKADENCYEWMRASASLPLVSTVVEIEGKKLLDGGISDSIPLEFFEKRGYEKNVVVLTQPRGYVKKKPHLISLICFAMRKYPGMAKALARRHKMYNDQKKYVFDKADRGEVFVICPDEPLEINRIERNPDKLREVYELGRKIAEQELERLKEYLNK
ncbi:MAG: patatin family protein [Clostridia bacterium]|nr:patatin family protein [Clostridia bacterium]